MATQAEIWAEAAKDLDLPRPVNTASPAAFDDLQIGQWVAWFDYDMVDEDSEPTIESVGGGQIRGPVVHGAIPAGDEYPVSDMGVYYRVTRNMCDNGSVFILTEAGPLAS